MTTRQPKATATPDYKLHDTLVQSIIQREQALLDEVRWYRSREPLVQAVIDTSSDADSGIATDELRKWEKEHPKP